MRKFTPYFFGIVGLGLGFAIGAVWVLRMHTFLAWHQSSTSTSIEANMAVASLRFIRSGDTNKAIEDLEKRLDRTVIYLADICRECPRPETETFPFQALARARTYRGDFPRKTDNAHIDGAVSRAFAFADKTKKQ
jgi:hypothetical protein